MRRNQTDGWVKGELSVSADATLTETDMIWNVRRVRVGLSHIYWLLFWEVPEVFMQQRFRFDPIDPTDLARWMSLSNGGRIQTMLDARQLVFGLIRGQLRQFHPDLDDRELTLKLFEELERRAKRKIPQF